MSRTFKWVAGSLVTAIVGVIAFVALIFTFFFLNSDEAQSVSACNAPGITEGSTDGSYSAAQLQYVQQIVAVGREFGVSDRGLQIAIMTVLVESGLKNYANSSVSESLSYPHDAVGSDHDSVGLFQQRPAAGWGSVQELMTVSYQAKAFFGGPQGPNCGSPRGLLDIAGWETMEPGSAAQAVQVSAFPDRYREQATAAAALLGQAGAGVECTPGTPSSAAGDDYPWSTETILDDGGVFSPLRYGYRECVDFVAWRINRDAGVGPNGPWKYTWGELTPGGGHAVQWKGHWESRGWAVSKTPQPGAVAWWGYSVSAWGHVAYVQAVNPDGSVVLEEYNYGFNHAYNTRTVPASSVEAFLSPPPSK